MNRAVNTKEVEELAEAAENLTIISIETTDGDAFQRLKMRAKTDRRMRLYMQRL